jgi:adenylylsulfate kinase-like enzyme
MITWLTGQSGAGKTTLANLVSNEVDCIILDGDEMRESISKELTYTLEDRKTNQYSIARLASVLSRQKDVVVASIAPTQEIRDEITNICNPKWIYIKRTIPERKNHIYEEPTDYFTIDNDFLRPEEGLKMFMKRCYNPNDR